MSRLSVAIALAAGAGVWQLLGELGDDRLAALTAGLALAVCLAIGRWRRGLSLVSPPMLYLGVFGLFHLGMALPWALGLYSKDLPAWFLSHRLTPALALVALAICCYLAGLLWVRPRDRPSPGPPAGNWTLFSAGVAVALAGGWMLLAGIENFGGARFWEATYGETYRMAQQFDPRWFGASFTMIPIGLYLAAAAASPRATRWVLWLALPWTAGMFYLGYRGHGLITGLVVFSLARKRGLQTPRWTQAALAALIILSIPVGRELRDQPPGERSLAGAWEQARVLEGVVEMGGSLRPLVHTLVYMAEEPWRGGATYGRSLGRIWPNLSADWAGGGYIALQDLPPNHWLTARAEPEVFHRHGGLGFSAVAEPYMNFGAPGVVVYFVALGALLGKAAQCCSQRPAALAAWAMILGPLLWTTRNSFEVLFRPAAWGLGVVMAAWLCSRLARAAESGGYSCAYWWRPRRAFIGAPRVASSHGARSAFPIGRPTGGYLNR